MAPKISVSSLLKTLLENCHKTNHRCLLPIIGSGTEHIMIIHHLISKNNSENGNILWCHKKDSNISNQNKKHLKKLKKDLDSGKLDISSNNAFDLFLLSTSIKFCSYEDTQKILGSTYSMCILQDFENCSPNILCRTIETVKGGGCILLHFPDISHLRELFNLPMKVHQRLKTHTHRTVVPLFNERFVISLGWCKNCLILDDKLEVLHQIASIKSEISPISNSKIEEDRENQVELMEVTESLKDADKPLPQLINLCKTSDQAKAVLKMIDVITDRKGKTTVAISSGRGRGKSAAMGIAVAGAIHSGLSNIFVVSPSPQNLKSFFDFLLKGFDALEYSEDSHYDVLQSVNPEFKDSIIRINLFANHRQTIRYVDPSDWKKVSQAELVVIDEAASIPLPQVRSLLGNHNVFMASTINGYEGTGRSLSLKLLFQLRQQSLPSGTVATSSGESSIHANCRPLHEVTLERSIRYSPKDPIEAWMNRLLCLEATSFVPPVASCPPPSECELYYVNRNVLLSGHRDTEDFLYQVISLLVSSHYRNSPDDLQILSDAPAHHLFVLLAPLPKTGSVSLPPVFCVLQVCLEGGIPSKVSSDILNRNERPNGDLIPWTLATQFLKPKLTKMSSIRIVRVATHPDYQSMGYGSRAIKLLVDYYKRKFISLDESPKKSKKLTIDSEDPTNLIAPRELEKSLLMKLSERTPEDLNYIGVSFGLTEPLFKFWTRLNFIPFYVSQALNKITGEHNCVMINPLLSLENKQENPDDENMQLHRELPKFLQNPAKQFLHRFTGLLSGPFREMNSKLALSVVNSHQEYLQDDEVDWNDVRPFISGHDLNRLEAYSKHLVDRHNVTDLFPSISVFYFKKMLPSVHLSPVQAMILLGIGLQYRPLEELANELSLKKEAAIGLFNRMARRFLSILSEIQQKEVAKHLPVVHQDANTFTPVAISLDEDLSEAAKEFNDIQLKKTSLGDVREFIIAGDEAEWQKALNEPNPSSFISIKSNKRPAKMTEEELEKELEDPKERQKKKFKKKKQ